MARKIYLVDTENVGFAWKHLLEHISSTDKIILFYTENTPYLSYLDLAYLQSLCDKFTLEKCYTGKNALDFQLVSYMGYHMKSSTKAQFIIVSNDSGYDSVIQYWLDKERRITRMTSNDMESLSIPKMIDPSPTTKKVDNDSTTQITKVSNPQSKCADTSLENALEDSCTKEDIHWILLMLTKYSLAELQKIHRALTQKFGNTDGTTRYRTIKPLLKKHYNTMNSN